MMLTLLLAGALAQVPRAQEPVRDVASLLEAMERLQSPVRDFRCEYEGTRKFPEAGDQSFAGVLLWRNDGDAKSVEYRPFRGHVGQEARLVRERSQAYEWARAEGVAGTLGNSARGALEPDLTASGSGPFDAVLPLERLKAMVRAGADEFKVEDDRTSDRAVKVLSIHSRPDGEASILRFRMLIDMARSGRVVRIERFFMGKTLVGVDEVVLRPFRVGEAKVWMPVAVEQKSYISKDERGLTFSPEPTSVALLRVVDGSMEFNTGLDPSAITLQADVAPAPRSPEFRKLEAQYRQGLQATSNSRTTEKARAAARARVEKAFAQGTLVDQFYAVVGLGAGLFADAVAEVNRRSLAISVAVLGAAASVIVRRRRRARAMPTGIDPSRQSSEIGPPLQL